MSEEVQPKNISSVETKYLDQPPSCLEFCPVDPNYFVVGTYLLQETRESAEEKTSKAGDEDEDEGIASGSVKQTKTGSLQLWHLDATAVATSKLQRKQVVPLPYAVFDIKFHPIRQHILGVAGSDGSISVYSVSKEDHRDRTTDPQIQHYWTSSAEHPGVSALYFSWFPEDWFPLASIPYTDGFVVSFSNGTTRTCVLDPLPGKSYDIAKNKGSKNGGSWQFISTEYLPERRKNIEPWFLALAKYQNPNLPGGMESYMFTGDDMGTLWKQSYSYPDDGDHSYDLEEMWSRCDYTNTDDEGRHHTAGGVTSILPLPISHLVKKAPIILTGSYDEYIRVYHTTFKGSVLAEKRLGGGVWRLQIIDIENITNRAAAAGEPFSEIRYLILASCMHAGTRIVRVIWKRSRLSNDEIGDWDIEVLALFTEHESMNYASGVWRGGNNATTGTELVCVSSSFYDKRLCLWKAQV
ncbi:hypothetical protein TMatcc_010460 [Talaromyces marneffei ATCC 18224]|uniref:WD repeat protein n=1 Tax=Talaromyces marneffei (strain ATCC 18224 / CBS 334.59 / QM 7333) TaxID=441960 RepID=B6QVJ2_TALMQ|nr:conserved hypothetical protein [Talaromyces marneffei ATCC 18224]